MNVQDPGEIKRSLEIDRLLSVANVHRMRGEFIDAEDTCKHILELDPENLIASELLADILYARGKLDEASAAYKALLAKDTNRANIIEEKYARTVLEIGEREYQKRAAQEALEHPESAVTVKRSGTIAVLLSLVAPGVGHIFLGQLTKGLIILGVFLFSWMIVVLSPGTHFFAQQLGEHLRNPRAAVNTNFLDPWAIFCVGIGIFTYIYGIIDASVMAGKSVKGGDMT